MAGSSSSTGSSPSCRRRPSASCMRRRVPVCFAGRRRSPCFPRSCSQPGRVSACSTFARARAPRQCSCSRRLAHPISPTPLPPRPRPPAQTRSPLPCRRRASAKRAPRAAWPPPTPSRRPSRTSRRMRWRRRAVARPRCWWRTTRTHSASRPSPSRSADTAAACTPPRAPPSSLAAASRRTSPCPTPVRPPPRTRRRAASASTRCLPTCPAPATELRARTDGHSPIGPPPWEMSCTPRSSPSSAARCTLHAGRAGGWSTPRARSTRSRTRPSSPPPSSSPPPPTPTTPPSTRRAAPRRESPLRTRVPSCARGGLPARQASRAGGSP
mmetsp:Transcript_26160/g.64598  ORF Transcript_26160/g.64598 Transcript_26160/m.64598 type:complete len:326 (-) Transcript_26160:184-1161(-)